MSIAESKICKPFVKQSTKLDQVTLVLLISYGCSVFGMFLFDLFLITNRNRSKKLNQPQQSPTAVFVVLFATTILYLSSKSFDKTLFCSMNMKETICGKQGNFIHEGALHTIEDPIYISAPCRVFPVGYGRSRDLDILVINKTLSLGMEP